MNFWGWLLTNSGVPGTHLRPACFGRQAGESALVREVASDRPGARHRSVFRGGAGGVSSPLLLHLLAVPLAELDGGELIGRLLILDADGEFLFATTQGVADGAGAADLDGVGFFYSKL